MTKEKIEYNFIIHKTREHYLGINISKTYTNLSQSFYELLGKPTNVEIQIDRNNKAIMFKPVPESINSFKLRQLKASTTLNTCLNKILPEGRYSYREKLDEGFICVYD